MSAFETSTMPFPVTWAGKGYWRVQRLFDIIVSACLLRSPSPLLLAIACAIQIHSLGPALFLQERVGYDRATGRIRRLKLHKFHSMHVNADPSVHAQHVRNRILNNVTLTDAQPLLKMVGDRRATGVGQILRRFSLDELPQLIDVLNGDLSLVGPGLDLMKSRCPDTVLVDTDVPGINRLAKPIALCWICRKVPIFLLRLYDDPVIRARARAVGAAALVVKSAPADTLLATIRQASQARFRPGNEEGGMMPA